MALALCASLALAGPAHGGQIGGAPPFTFAFNASVGETIDGGNGNDVLRGDAGDDEVRATSGPTTSTGAPVQTSWITTTNELRE